MSVCGVNHVLFWISGTTREAPAIVRKPGKEPKPQTCPLLAMYNDSRGLPTVLGENRNKYLLIYDFLVFCCFLFVFFHFIHLFFHFIWDIYFSMATSASRLGLICSLQWGSAQRATVSHRGFEYVKPEINTLFGHQPSIQSPCLAWAPTSSVLYEWNGTDCFFNVS